jgi:hypothetical protein
LKIGSADDDGSIKSEKLDDDDEDSDEFNLEVEYTESFRGKLSPQLKQILLNMNRLKKQLKTQV